LTGRVSDPSHFQANLQRGALLLNQRRPNDALPFLQAAIAANPDAPQGYAELARCWNEMPKERWKSIGAIDRAIALAPGNSFYHGRKGWFLVCLLRYRGALLAAQDGLALNPHCPQSLNAQANAYTKLAQWKKAEQACRRILADDPNDTPGLNLLAQALRRQGRWKESREVVAHLLANTPNNAFGQANAGYAALAAGDHLRANEHFLNSLRMDPHFDLARRGLLQSLRARIWTVRINMRAVTYMRQPSSPKRVLFWVLLFVGGVLALGGVTRGLDWIHPHAGGAFLDFLGSLLGMASVGLLLWIYLSGIVAMLGNFLLLFDPLGRNALTRPEKRRAVLPAVLSGLAMGVFAVTGLWIEAVILIALFLVLAGTIQYPLLRDRWQRRRLEKSAT
jgi:tetratricopeptide (TPR) repeat protein